MDQPFSDRLVVVQLKAVAERYSLILEDGQARGDFELWFEDAAGIRLLVGADDLTRWLMRRGKLWALPPIRRLLDGAVVGRVPMLPCRLDNPDVG